MRPHDDVCAVTPLDPSRLISAHLSPGASCEEVQWNMAWLTLLATATACLSLLFLPLMPSQKEEVRRLAELPRSRAAGWAMLALLAFLVIFGTALRPGPVKVDVRSLHTVVCEQARPSPCCQSSRRRPASRSPAERGARAALLAAGCRKVPERRGVPERRRAALRSSIGPSHLWQRRLSLRERAHLGSGRPRASGCSAHAY